MDIKNAAVLTAALFLWNCGGGSSSPQIYGKTLELPDKNNSGANMLIAAIPGDKPQGEYAAIPSANVAVSASGNGAGNAARYLRGNIPEDANTILQEDSEEDFHKRMRLIENELLTEAEQPEAINGYARYAITKKYYEVGKNYSFYTILNSGGSVNVNCIDNGTHAYYFVEDSVDLSAELLSSYRDGFGQIYPIVTGKFGPEGDVDQNGKILIIFYDMDKSSDTIGYFYAADKYPRSPSYPNSNQADVFYINSRFMNDPETVLGTLAHEFQHMTYFNNKYIKISQGVPSSNYNNDTWFNEGLSMLSSYYANYAGPGSNNEEWITSFLSGGYKNLSLTYWTSRNYGYSALFAQYLNDIFGDGFPKTSYASGFGGIKAVEKASAEDFNNIFADFALALYLSGTPQASGRHAFKSLDIPALGPLNYSQSYQINSEKNVSVPLYGLALIFFNGRTDSVSYSSRENINGWVYPEAP